MTDTLASENQDESSDTPFINLDLVAQCDRLIESYRSGGEQDKGSVLAKLREILDGHDPQDQEAQVASEAAFRTFSVILDNIDSVKAAAAARGGGGMGNGQPGPDDRDDSSDGSGEPGVVGTGNITNITSRPAKRARSPESFTDEEGYPLKRKVSLSKLTWVVQEALITPESIPDDLRRTAELIENHSRDVNRVKASLLNSYRVPQFPDSQWSSVLLGKYVDLDHVFSGVYALADDDRKKEKLGTLEFVLGTGSPAKNVKSHSDWTIAWGVYVEAVLYVFPHRARELTAHGTSISQLFASVPHEYHTRVINYDKAVRLRVGSRRDLRLTDLEAFSDLKTAYITFGVGMGGREERDRVGSGGSQSSGRKKRDACKRFNAGKCPNTQSACNYAHVCSSCRSTGHVASACSKQ